jgi:hypothetical protein
MALPYHILRRVASPGGCASRPASKLACLVQEGQLDNLYSATVVYQ